MWISLFWTLNEDPNFGGMFVCKGKLSVLSSWHNTCVVPLSLGLSGTGWFFPLMLSSLWPSFETCGVPCRDLMTPQFWEDLQNILFAYLPRKSFVYILVVTEIFKWNVNFE